MYQVTESEDRIKDEMLLNMANDIATWEVYEKKVILLIAFNMMFQHVFNMFFQLIVFIEWMLWSWRSGAIRSVEMQE